MKYFASLAVLSGLVFISSSSCANAQGLWQGLPLGASKEEIKKRFPNAHTYYEGTHHFERYGFDALKYNKCILTVNFLLENGKLNEVQIGLNEASTKTEYCQKYLFNSLNEKYGNTTVNHGSFMDTALWHTSEGILILADWMSLPATNTYLIHVRYKASSDKNLM